MSEERQEHTPGPWAVLQDFPTYIVPADHAQRPSGVSIFPDQDRDRYALNIANANCDGYSPDEFTHRIRRGEALANARLIAAAPDMLIELKRAEKFIALNPRNFDIENLRAVITKATGAGT